MKLFMKILVSFFAVFVLLCMVPFQSTCAKLQEDVLRLHIIANSDTATDQEMKLKVRDKVLSEISPMYNGVYSKEEAIRITKDNLVLIESISKEVVEEYGCGYDVKAQVKNNFFDTRYYDDFTMPAGMYETLLITIGEANGKNWWCVMYPGLCVGASSELQMKEDLTDNEYKVITSTDVEYKFKIVEYYEKVKALFY